MPVINKFSIGYDSSIFFDIKFSKKEFSTI